MNALLVTVLVALLSQAANAQNEATNNDSNIDVQCAELQENLLGSLISRLPDPIRMDKVDFYLAVKNDNKGIKIDINSLSTIESNNFDPALKTCIIIHGYMANYQTDWVVGLKDSLLENRKINIILVDWSTGSYNWNYITSVRETMEVARNVFRLLEAMQTKLESKGNGANLLWNNLYFIGHSLGAQISGQAARLLQSNKFFSVERITGMDPARPCFKKEPLDIKLDKSDAKFVDVIHTQAGGYGVKEATGHIDFYVNGGALQPTCMKSRFQTTVQKRTCSHVSGCADLIASIIASNSTDCRFWGYKWDGTYDDALKIFDEVKKEQPCTDCPEMGINAVNNQINGVFLVFTAIDKPECKWPNEDVGKVLEALKEI